MILHVAPDLRAVLPSLAEQAEQLCAAHWAGVGVVPSGIGAVPSDIEGIVVLHWEDGPPLAAVAAVVEPLSEVRCTVEVPHLPPLVKVSKIIRCVRRYSHRSQAVGVALLGVTGFPPLPNVSYAKRAPRPWTPAVLRDLEDSGAEESIFEASAELLAAVDPLLDSLDLSSPVDLSTFSPDPAFPALVDLVERLSADAGIEDLGDLLLWASSGGFDLAVSLLPGPLQRARS